MKKILIIQKRVGIGDFCVFLPTINEIAKFFNNHQIDILTQKRTQAKEFTFDHKYINEIFYVPNIIYLKRVYGFLNHIRKSNYEKCFIFHYGFRYFLCNSEKIKNVFLSMQNYL